MVSVGQALCRHPEVLAHGASLEGRARKQALGPLIPGGARCAHLRMTGGRWKT